MQKLIIANWKMNPTSVKEAKRIFTATKQAVTKLKGIEVVVCPPVLYLPVLAKERQSTKVVLGVQDLSHEDMGPYTGQVSAPMVLDLKARWAILGHSERRACGETNELVAQKVKHTILKGVSPIVCVGESERNDEGAQYTFVRTQLYTLFDALKRKDAEKLTIAYEPIWAIGKSADEAMKTPELYEMALYIRKLLVEQYGRKIADSIRILYGGAVKSDNAGVLMREGGVDGLLVGSASLNPKEFGEVVQKMAVV
jgi:triosephosphate isomerase (TIM)